MNTIIDFEITGMSPLMMHSDRFANPIAPETIEHKKLTSKRTKTIEDQHAIARSEWMGALYWDKKLGVYIPAPMIRKCIITGARLFKLGKHVERGVLLMEMVGFPLIYEGPKDPAKLYEKRAYMDYRTVIVSQSRLMRCRPRFDEWSCKGSLTLNESQLSREDLHKAFEAAGLYCGMGEYRPNKGGSFGRFTVELN